MSCCCRTAPSAVSDAAIFVLLPCVPFLFCDVVQVSFHFHEFNPVNQATHIIYICATTCGTLASVLALAGRGWSRISPRVPLLRTAMWIAVARTIPSSRSKRCVTHPVLRQQLGTLLTLVWIPMYCYATANSVSLESKIISIGTILLLMLPIYLFTIIWLVFALHHLILEVLAKSQLGASSQALLNDAEANSSVPLELERSVPHGRARRGSGRTMVGGSGRAKEESKERWSEDESSGSERGRY